MAERLSDFSLQKLGETRIWVDRRLSQKAFVEAMADPDRLFDRPDCQVVKDERKIKVARVTVTIGGLTRGVYIKRYNAFSRPYRIASIFRRSRAVRSLAGATILTRAGVSVGRPLAAVEVRRWGMLAKSFFVTEEILCGKTVDSYWREELKPLTGSRGFKGRRKFLAALAGLFRQLHSRCIYHNDLKDANILVKENPNEGESFYLLDLEGVRACCYLSKRRRLKNIVQLNRTLGRFLSKTEKLYLLRQYFSGAIDDRDVRSWIASLLPMTERAERRSALKQRLLSANPGTDTRTTSSK